MDIDYSRADYVAGVIDAGSYITLMRTGNGFVPRVQIHRNKQDVIDEVNLFFPGYKSIVKKNHGNRYGLHYQGKKAIEFLWLIYPRLKDKKRHAEILFEFGRAKKRFQKEHGAHAKLTPEEEKLRSSIWMEINKLTKKPNADAETESIFDRSAIGGDYGAAGRCSGGEPGV